MEAALERIRVLAAQVGSRRPCSGEERLAARWLASDLREHGIDADVEGFDGYPTFGLPFGLISGAAVAAGLLPSGRLRRTLALGSAATLALEGDLRLPWLSRLLSRKRSQNVVATIEPAGQTLRTVCLLSHIDTSRSGLMFHPAAARHLGRWITIQSLAGLLQGAEPLIGRSRIGARAVRASRLVLAAGFALLIEREIRGEDVPGANDNASGVAVAATLATEIAASPLASTRVVFCAAGCEEAGTLGAQAFTEARDTEGWLFLNFDSVGGRAPLKFLTREGVIARWDADARLVAIAERIAASEPGLISREQHPAGLTYDTSHILARGGRALSFSAQDGYIPDLHWPTDTFERIDPSAIERALRAGRGMLAAIDGGEAD